MQKYNSYKATGVSWLPTMPSHWNLSHLRKYLSLVSIKDKADKILLSVTREQGVIVRNAEDQEENHNFIPEDLSGYKYVQVGQFVINKMKSWQGSYGVSSYEGIVSPAYFVCDLKCENKEFFSKAIRSRAYVDFFAQWSKGIRVGQWDLEPNALKTIPFFEPQKNEQERIVAYLNKKIPTIDSFIAAKQHQVELLEEYKQAIIAQAVTRGLNPDVKMKFMDTPLQCEHPEHWKRVRNMSFMVEQSESVGKNSNDFALLSLTTNGVILRDMESGKGKFPKDFESYSKVEPNEIIFCLFDIDETPRTVGLSRNYGMITGAYDIFKIKESLVLPEYVYYYYLAIDNIKALRPYYSGLRKVVKHNRFMQIGFPMPLMDEQQEIVNYIKAKAASIDNLKASITQEISLLQEYKQRLISDVVTGQINVQNEIV